MAEAGSIKDSSIEGSIYFVSVHKHTTCKTIKQSHNAQPYLPSTKYKHVQVVVARFRAKPLCVNEFQDPYKRGGLHTRLPVRPVFNCLDGQIRTRTGKHSDIFKAPSITKLKF
jgi:hypothetical protein